jgi:hypothetical protein
MRRHVLIVWLAFGLVATAEPQKPSSEFDYVRHTMVLSDSFVPKGGYVPDAGTAIAIADAVTVPIYGRSQVDREKPLRAELEDGKWLVLGTLHGATVGGTLEVLIDQMTGKILYLNHSM